MENERRGILAAGNWIVDQVKLIDRWPQQDALANILEESQANGGSPYNVLKDLSRLGAQFPLYGCGLVGDDPNGQWILRDCAYHNIDTSGLKFMPGAHTSYTDVMTVKGTGRRTFFHQRGANAHFSEKDVELKSCNARVFHLGYLLLLDSLDFVYPDGTTGASRLFQEAQTLGYVTSADLVSESSDRFKTLVPPSLPYLNYLFLNEYEAEKVTGIPISMGDYLDLEKAEDAAIALLEMGVQDWVILHFPKGSLAVSRKTGTVFQPSLKIPAERVVGAAGAGDAFASGVLYGIHEQWPMQKALQLGVATAAGSLFSSTCSDSVRSREEMLGLIDEFGYHTIESV